MSDKAKIVLHHSGMPIMDASRYWAEFEEGTTLGDLIQFIETEYADANGEIRLVGEDTEVILFTEGHVAIPPEQDVLDRHLVDVNVTAYYNWNHTTSIDVILE